MRPLRWAVALCSLCAGAGIRAAPALPLPGAGRWSRDTGMWAAGALLPQCPARRCGPVGQRSGVRPTLRPIGAASSAPTAAITLRPWSRVDTPVLDYAGSSTPSLVRQAGPESSRRTHWEAHPFPYWRVVRGVSRLV